MADITLDPPIESRAASSPRESQSLAERLSALRRRSGFVVTDRSLLVAGSILMPLGAVLVLLAWYGASHTTRVFEQIPYLISGGLLGLVLAIAGGFCYFGYFLARILSTSREMLDSLLRLEERLEATGAMVPGPVAGAATGAGVARPAGLATVSYVATKTGTMYHRPDCSAVAGRPPAELRRVQDTAGLSPCRLCIDA